MGIETALRVKLQHLETPRLKMDIATQKDVGRIHELQSEEGMEQITIVKTYAQTRQAVVRWGDDFEEQGLGVYTLTTKDENDFIGTAGLGIAQAYTSYQGKPELCHSRVFSCEQGKGYITEARKRLISVAFDDLGIPTLRAHSNNPIQWRGYEREGFSYETRFYYNEQFPVLKVYALTKAEYDAKKQLLPEKT